MLQDVFKYIILISQEFHEIYVDHICPYSSLPPILCPLFFLKSNLCFSYTHGCGATTLKDTNSPEAITVNNSLEAGAHKALSLHKMGFTWPILSCYVIFPFRKRKQLSSLLYLPSWKHGALQAVRIVLYFQTNPKPL